MKARRLIFGISRVMVTKLGNTRVKVISVVVFTCVSVQYEIKMNTNKQRMSSLFTVQHGNRNKDNTQIGR